MKKLIIALILMFCVVQALGAVHNMMDNARDVAATRTAIID